MFSTLRPQYPSLPNDVYSRSSLNSRDRYLAALAEAKAAEADYLADEAVRREEEALRQRLEEIQLRKRHEQLSRYQQPLGPYSYSYGSHDRLALLRQELEEEELRQAAATRERGLEVLRRREFEEARALALKRQQEEQTLELLTRRRQEEEKRLLALRQEQQIEKARRVRQTSSRPTIQFGLEAAKTPQPISMHSRQHVPSCTPFTARSVSTCPSTQFDEVLKLLSGQATQSRDAPKKQGSVPHKPVVRFVVDETKAHLNKSSQSSVPQKQPTPLVSSSTSQAQVPTPTSSINEQVQSRPHEEEANEIRDTIQAIFASLADAASYASSGNAEKQSTSSFAPSVSLPPSKGEEKSAEPTRAFGPASSLKEQLEARLRNDETVEIRDTIQAILASLADAAHASANLSTSSASATSASSSSAEGKGKGKENVASESTSVTTEPTSADVLKSMETVRNIEASFLTLQSDFVFPSQIDFTPTSSRSPSPTRSSENEPLTPTSDSTVLKLAYTSRNHPVRYYEQTLSALLTQLDDVQSFGNEEVRALRKEVVGRVKKAIDELEGEIEGRWRSKVAKESRETREAEVVSKEGTSVAEPASAGLLAPNHPSTVVSQESASDSIEHAESQVELENDDSNNQTPSVTPREEQKQETTLTATGDFEPVSSESNNADESLQQDTVASSLDQSLPQPVSSYPPSPPVSSASVPRPSLSASSSVATIRPYDIDPESESESKHDTGASDSEDVDTFLIPASSTPVVEKKPAYRDEADSDWSELEA
ncbi:hypothetical protein VKT23_002936 [Stygiomarasmius scandens]|uniref:BAG domain-containing protein n=1 Tax=Marasmiellus scandens TaxID=2682957 RepID=A0ABR1K222_9AGAR